MSRLGHVRLMADYNAWMNERLCAAAARLPAAEVAAPRGAFFGSLLGTLNHLVVGDRIWLTRFAAHPRAFPELDAVCALPHPPGLDSLMFDTLDALHQHRRWLDERIVAWAGTLTEPDLDHVLAYANTKGVRAERPFFSLVMHFFNHQTHHRGQATTLLSQAGVDVGVTDLLALIPDRLAR